MSDSLWPSGLQPTRLLCPWNSPGKNTGVDCHFLLQRVLPTQGSNLGLWHCRQTLHQLSHQGSLCINLKKEQIQIRRWLRPDLSGTRFLSPPGVKGLSLCMTIITKASQRNSFNMESKLASPATLAPAKVEWFGPPNRDPSALGFFSLST